MKIVVGVLVGTSCCLGIMLALMVAGVGREGLALSFCPCFLLLLLLLLFMIFFLGFLGIWILFDGVEKQRFYFLEYYSVR